MWFFNTRVGRWLSVAGAFLAALLGAWLTGRRDGGKAAKQKAKDLDHEHAADIRDSVRNNLDDELRKHDGAGWRD